MSGTTPKFSVTVEAAVAGAVEVGRAGRRIFQRMWDAEPVNNRSANEPAWCLGRSYSLATKNFGSSLSSSSPSPPAGAAIAATTPPSDATDLAGSALSAGEDNNNSSSRRQMAAASAPASAAQVGTETPPDSVASSFDSSLAYEEPGLDGGWPPAFVEDFESRIWMTYRTGFPLIPRSSDPRAATSLSITMRLRTSFSDQAGFTSDTGWGCMIRSGQSLLANAMSICRLGRDWRRTTDPDAEREIISLFADDPRAPYSLHNFVRHGAAACGKYPGEWFGPSATARCIKALTSEHPTSLRVYSTGDFPDVYEDSFMAVANPDGQGFQPTLILVATRLGTEKINQVYEQALIDTLKMSQSVGIAGGRPSSSHYFVGVQGRWLFYVDPHHPRPALPYHQNPGDYAAEDVDSCHTRRLRHLQVEDMDPSMLMGFLIRDESDWAAWKAAVRQAQGKAIINVSPHDPARGGGGGMGAVVRAEAIDEVETLSDDDDDDDDDDENGDTDTLKGA